MKYITSLVIGSLIFFSCTKPNQKNRTKYEIVEYEIAINDHIFDVSSIARYESTILMLSKNKLYGLDVNDKTVKEYPHNLDKLDEIILLEDSLVFVSNDDLYRINSIKVGAVIFENYKYISAPRPYYSESVFYTKEFTISSCCRGEWGGSAFFEDINTNKIYSTASTCLFNVDTLDSNLYLFNFLPHLSTFTYVFKVGDVKSLKEVTKEHECNWFNDLYKETKIEADSINSIMRGNKDRNELVFDTIGMPILHGFIDDKQLKLIRGDRNKLLVLSILTKNEVSISSTLVELEEGRKLESGLWNYKDNAIISCTDSNSNWNDKSPKKLTHIVNINKKNKLIEIFKLN